MEQILGTIASITTVIYVILGLPKQVMENKKRKSVEGLSLRMFVLSFVTWLSWTIYAVAIKNRIINERIERLVQKCTRLNLIIAYSKNGNVILTFAPNSGRNTGNYFCDSALKIAKSIWEVFGSVDRGWLKTFTYVAKEFVIKNTGSETTSEIELVEWLKKTHPLLN